MGFWGKAAKFAVATAATIGIVKAIGKLNDKNEENKRRRNTPCDFDDIITEDVFEQIAFKSVKKSEKE